MQISCPSCKTRISVPDEKIKPEGTKVKCGKCSKVFTVKRKAGDTAPAPAQAAPVAPAPPPPPPEDDIFGGDNFGAEMDNYKTQLRPMGSARTDDLFGSGEDLSPTPSKAPSLDTDDVSSLFGSGDDLAPAPSPAEQGPADEEDDPLDKFVADIRASKAEQAPEPPPPSPASKGGGRDNLDDLFGKGLDNSADDFATQLFDKPKAPKKAPAAPPPPDIDSLFDQPAQPAAPKAPPTADRLDALFEDDTPAAAPAPAPQARRPEPAALSTRPPQPRTPSAEELAASMNLEPALKEEDAPRTAPPKAPEPKGQKSARKFPVKAIALTLLLLAILGGGATVALVPAVQKPVLDLVRTLPLDQLTGLLESEEKGPVNEPVRHTVTVTASRMLVGARGDNLFVVEGTVRNDYADTRSFIRVRGTLTDAEGNVISTREVFAGNTLNDEEIRGLDRVRIDGTLNRSVGGGLMNLDVAPQNAIPFQIIFYDVQEPIGTPRVEASGSEPGS